ncbi:MAG: Calx-beta domain-containing protein [Acidobacteriota bacterium]
MKMTPNEIELLKSSFHEINERADESAEVFYDILFSIRPTLRLLFPADMDDQKQKLMAALKFAIWSLDRLDVFMPAIEDLGRKHAHYGVRDEHYESVGTALLLMLKQVLGDKDLGSETTAAWIKMYEIVAGTMRNAARDLANISGLDLPKPAKPKGAQTMSPSTHIVKRHVTLLHAIYTFLLSAIFMIFATGANAATFTVTNTSDSAGSVCAAGNCSLRQAITAANALPDADTINFNIPGSGVRTITFTGQQLPAITSSVTIDGTTQPGYSGFPLIELNGNNATNYGLLINSNATIRAFTINRFLMDGIAIGTIGSTTNVTITGSFIGTTSTGTDIAPNGGHGISIAPTSGTINIGGTGLNERNVISGNRADGISIDSCQFYDPPPVVNVLGNVIGLDHSGNIDLGNLLNGVEDACSNATNIGGASAAARNVISGNEGAGILLSGGNAVVQGNYIGLSSSGVFGLGNSSSGIVDNTHSYSENGNGNIIGGSGTGMGNVISGNTGDGIRLSPQVLSTLVQGNKVGTKPAGTSALPNTQNGIYIGDGINITIGGLGGSAGNLVSGNGASGIKAEGAQTTNDLIIGNQIGVTPDTQTKLPNAASGIFIDAKNISVGQAGVSNSQNVISGNNGDGITITSSFASNNVIENNFIGTNLTGANLGNGGNGVQISLDAHDNRIGGSNTTAANVIAFNTHDGVSISGNLAINNMVRSNSVVSNGELGIDLGTNGVNANDAGDGDSGANNLQNFPLITTAFPNSVSGTLNSSTATPFAIDIYRNNACDASGNGEGQFYLGTANVVTDATGNAGFNLGLPLNVGQSLSATATDANGNTSEFGPCFTVTGIPGSLGFSASTYSVNEAAGTATISVTRTFGSFGPVSVNYATSNGTATAGQDYTTASGTLSWANGDTTAKTFTIPITSDAIDEPNETVNLTLTSPTNGAGLLTPTSVVTIVDDDNPPTISVSDVLLPEGNQGTTNFTFNVTLSAPSGQTVVVDYSTANGTATTGIDYAFNADTLVFNPGQTTKTVTIAVNGDTLSELDETFFVNLQDPQNAGLGKGQGIGTIQDDDNPGKIQFGVGSNVGEAAGTAIIQVRRLGGTAGTVSIDYATANGTATAGQDYIAASGTLIFNDGQTIATFSVPILQDNIGESNETVFLTLSNPTGGAGLGSPITRSLVIVDDDGGLPSSVSIGGQIVENNAPLPNVLVTLAGSQSKTALTDVLGNYTFTNLSGGGNYLVTPNANGHTFEPFNLSYANLGANVTDANFISSTGPAARTVRVVNGDTVGGNAVVVPIELISQGNENSAGFSISYDPNLLSNVQVSLGADAAAGSLITNPQTGTVGIIVALPAGQHFTVGNRQIAMLTFMTAPTALYSTPIAFGNVPVAREITDQNAGVLPSEYADGAVTFSQGYEADVAPRPTGSGNGSVTVADYTMVGKFVAGTLTPDQLNEFQRADSAPRGTKGNGVLTVSDYTQAGRYAAALDPVQSAGGASSANFVSELAGQTSIQLKNKLASPRAIRVVNSQAAIHSFVIVSLELDSNGDENGVGFTLNYDPNKLANPAVSLGTGAATATLIPNTNISGKVGVVLAYPIGQSSPAGTKQLVSIRFDVAPSATVGPTSLTFSDSPVFREVVDANAEVLPATFTDGLVQIFGPTAANVSVRGRVSNSSGGSISRALVSVSGQDGQTRTAFTNSFGYFGFSDLTAGATYVFTVRSKGYTFSPEARAVSILEDIDKLDFIADK